jgi:hypothetical protein
MSDLLRRIKIGREGPIEEAVMAHPERLGFPGALALRNWRVSPTSGRLDVGLLPSTGSVQLVLVEAKAAAAPDAASKVVGQLLMYYAGALLLGTAGLAAIREYVSRYPEEARSSSKKSQVRLSGVSPSTRAWASLSAGERIRPDQLRMFVALDSDPHHALDPLRRTLYEHHGLAIGLVVVKCGEIERVSPPPAA